MAFAKSAAAWLAVMGIAFAGTDGGTGGGASPCTVDVKHDPGSSNCSNKGWCGSGGSAALPGGTIVKGTDGVPCCFTEMVVPPHDDLVPGNLRVTATQDVQGLIVFRKCDAPFTFLFITIGKWSCDIEQTYPFGTYHLYTLGPCEDPTGDPKSKE
jgi:hypothetical protein